MQDNTEERLRKPEDARPQQGGGDPPPTPGSGEDGERERQKEILQTVFDHIPVMISFFSPDGQLLLVNRYWEKVIGWSLEEARRVDDLLAACYPDPEYRRQVRDYILHPTPGWADFKTRARDGRTIDTSWSRIRLSDGSSIGFGLDVSDRRRAEDKLQEYYDRVQALSHRLLAVQEQERRHLARELHDGICQLLTSLAFAFEASLAAPPETAEEKRATARALLQEAIAQVRRLSFNLRPALLDHLGLLPALRDLIAHYTPSTGVRVNLGHAALEGRLAPDAETAAYRIVQEALANVARHARVAEVEVRVWVDAATLRIQVEDEGAGFDVKAALALDRSVGLAGMYERAAILGGRLTIDSAPGRGTHLLAELPLEGIAEAQGP
jgi:PAS domain S-box-containing protein